MQHKRVPAMRTVGAATRPGDASDAGAGALVASDLGIYNL